MAASGRAAGGGRVGVNEWASKSVSYSLWREGATSTPSLTQRAYFALTVLVGVMVFMNTGSPLEPTL
jgi:hypothetical protein